MKTTLKIGDTVYFNYGAMVGDDFGTVVGCEENQVWVRKSDFSLSTVSHLNGEVTGSFHTDYNGDEFLSARGVKGIGAYKLV